MPLTDRPPGPVAERHVAPAARPALGAALERLGGWPVTLAVAGVAAALRLPALDRPRTLVVVNLGDDEVTKTLQIDGFTPGGAAEVWLFDAEHNAEQIDSVEIADGATITVPGRSMTLYAVPAAS